MIRPAVAGIAPDDPGHGKKSHQCRAHAHRTAARTSSAVRCGKGFVQIELNDIKAQVSRPCFAQKGIGVGAVTIKQTTFAVYNFRNFFDIAFKQAQRVGVGEHQGCDIFRHQRFQMFKINAPFRVGPQGDCLKPAQRSGRRICAVSSIRNQNQMPLFAFFLKILFDHHDAGEFSVRAGRRLQGELSHAENTAQQFLHVMHQLQIPLSKSIRGLGMQARESGHGRDIFVNFRIVLHRAGTERIKTQIQAEVSPRQIGVMPHQVDFGHFRQIQVIAQVFPANDIRYINDRHITCGYICRAAPGPADFKN